MILSIDSDSYGVVYTNGVHVYMSYFVFLMIRRPPRSTLDRSSAASDVYKRQAHHHVVGNQATHTIHFHYFYRSADGSGRHGRRCCCLLYTSPSPRDRTRTRMPSSACQKKHPPNDAQHNLHTHNTYEMTTTTTPSSIAYALLEKHYR